MAAFARLTGRLIASGGGVGAVRPAPGTAGSLVALALGAGLLGWHPAALWAAAALAVVLGWVAIIAAQVKGDPG